METALKAVSHKNKVWILPNPEGAKTPDYLFRRGKVFKIYDLKKIRGVNSVNTDLQKAQGQSRRFILDISSKYKPLSLIKS